MAFNRNNNNKRIRDSDSDRDKKMRREVEIYDSSDEDDDDLEVEEVEEVEEIPLSDDGCMINGFTAERIDKLTIDDPFWGEVREPWRVFNYIASLQFELAYCRYQYPCNIFARRYYDEVIDTITTFAETAKLIRETPIDDMPVETIYFHKDVFYYILSLLDRTVLRLVQEKLQFPMEIVQHIGSFLDGDVADVPKQEVGKHHIVFKCSEEDASLLNFAKKIYL